ncbi:MAG: hypothetical protein PVI35_06335 [Acidimicrobiia bacterium]|jgi:hypothetical protein
MNLTVPSRRLTALIIATTAILTIGVVPATGATPNLSDDAEPSVVVASSTRIEPGVEGGRYTVTVTNEGSAPLSGLTVRYPVHDPILAASTDAGVATADGWELGELPAGATATLEFATAG